MYKKEYRTVCDVLYQAGQWAVHSVIFKALAPERVTFLHDMFWEACTHHDDKKAAEYWQWLMHAIGDVELHPLAQNGSGHLLISPDSKEVAEAGRRVQQKRAEMAMGLFPNLPVSQTVRKEEVATLLDTKKAMLVETGMWWRQTGDEEEAARLFQFLAGVKCKFDSDKEVRNAAIREVTNVSFPSLRLARMLVSYKIPQAGWQRDTEIAKILALAWVRNSGPEVVRLCLGAVLPVLEIPRLFGFSSEPVEAFAFLGRLAQEQVAPMEAHARELGGSMHGEAVLGFERKTVPGLTFIKYLGPRHLDVLVKEKSQYGGLDENTGHQVFEKAREHVLAFLQKNAGYRVHLTVTFVEYDWGGKECYRREQDFSA